MKVVHIVASIDKSSGGPARSVPKTCEYVSQLGVDIELIANPSANPIEVRTSSCFKVTFRTYRELLKTRLTVANKPVSLIHLQHIWSPYIHRMARLARLKNIPYVITPRGMLEPWIMHRNPLKKQLGMMLYQRTDLRRAACLQATCEAEKVSIRALGFTNPVAVIPNGVDLSVIPYPRTVRRTKKIVFISRIHQKKGLELLLQTWKELNLPDWTLELAGEGNATYIEKLKRKIKTEQIQRVSLVGPQYGADKWKFLETAEVMILPTYSENFGIVVAEALAFGIPVITTQGAPWAELETEQCGWWIDLSVANIVQALTEVINCTPEELAIMGERGRKLIERKYDIRKVAEDVKKMYDWMLGLEEMPEFVDEIKLHE